MTKPRPALSARGAAVWRAVWGIALIGLIAVASAQEAAAVYRPQLKLPLEQRQPLIVGAVDDSYPYSFRDEQGQLTGFAIDLSDAVARVMHLQVKRVAMTGHELHDRFRQGEFDFLQAYSDSPTREGYAGFSVPFLTLQGTLFVQKRDNPIHQVADLNGRDFAIIGVGSMGESFLADHGLHPNLVHVSSSEEALQLVDSGRCVGVFVSHLTALSVIDRKGLGNVAMFGEPLSGYDIRHCLSVHEGDSLLLARLNEGLAILHRTGEFDTIYRKWFGRFERSQFSREQVFAYGAAALALAFVVALWGFLRQRVLRKRIAGQAEELAEKEALLQALYDNIPMAMAVLEAGDDGPTVLTVNREAQNCFGVRPVAARGEPLTALGLTPELRDLSKDLLAHWPQAGSIVREERRVLGMRKTFVFTLVPLAPGTPGRARLCVLAEDVTDRRRLDEELARSRKLRAVGELVGGIAHEFNNLLTPVMLKVGEIQLDWATDTRLQGEVAVILQAVRRASELTRRLLTFGRKVEQRAEAVQLGSVVAGCFDLLRQTVDRRIVWESSVPEDLRPLTFNATDLNQILLNLLLNARDTLVDKFAQSRGDWVPRISVEVVELPPEAANEHETPEHGPLLGWQRLTVRDNGMGMSAEVRERVFEPFYTTKEVGKGTGLGLATVWHLVTESGGHIDLESRPGEGSAFHLLFPVYAGPVAPTSATSSPIPPPTRAARVFLAEDEKLVARTVIAALHRAGHQVVHSEDGAAAWKHLEEHLGDYDLLAFDVNMPGIDGIELTRRVRATGRFRGCVMILSGRLSGPEMHALAELSVDRVLPKPFTLDEFLGAVRDSLQTAAGR